MLFAKDTIRSKRSISILTLICALSVAGLAQRRQSYIDKNPAALVDEQSVRAHMEELASDKLHGRGSGTIDELAAATYIAGQLKHYGIKPAGDNSWYIQRVDLKTQSRRDPSTTLEIHTANVVGILRGRDPRLAKQAILLSAHMDHLGYGKPVNGDHIYNGADDDASGVTAVLELAHVLGASPRPKRTIVFALFGSEERGGFGATYFREHPPVPLENFVANLEFEMIGRPDPMVAPHTLWLTGYERSDLGSVLAAHGALLVADPHPEQNFFQRSDNYILAQRGVIAQTVSSFGLHTDYHQPSDDLAHIDFAHMTDSIASMVKPVLWLANTSFKPHWLPGGKP